MSTSSKEVINDNLESSSKKVESESTVSSSTMEGKHGPIYLSYFLTLSSNINRLNSQVRHESFNILTLDIEIVDEPSDDPPKETTTTSGTADANEDESGEEGDEYYKMYLAVAKKPRSSRDKDTADDSDDGANEDAPEPPSTLKPGDTVKIKGCSVNVKDVSAPAREDSDSPSTLDPRITRGMARRKANSVYIAPPSSPSPVNFGQDKEVRIQAKKSHPPPAVKVRGVQYPPIPEAKSSPKVDLVDIKAKPASNLRLSTVTPKTEKVPGFKIPKKQIISSESPQQAAEGGGSVADSRKRKSVWGPPKKLGQAKPDRYFAKGSEDERGSSDSQTSNKAVSDDDWDSPAPKKSARVVDDDWDSPAPVAKKPPRVVDDDWDSPASIPKKSTGTPAADDWDTPAAKASSTQSAAKAAAHDDDWDDTPAPKASTGAAANDWGAPTPKASTASKPAAADDWDDTPAPKASTGAGAGTDDDWGTPTTSSLGDAIDWGAPITYDRPRKG